MSKPKYTAAVESLLKATPEEALNHNREIRADENPDFAQILEQKLISFRLAIKVGNGRFLDENELHPQSMKNPQMSGEAHFVRAMILVHKENHSFAGREFSKAAEYYEIAGNSEKSLLSEFNSLIAQSTGGLLSLQQELNLCSEILRKAQEKSSLKMQALCLRQKSYSYFSSGRTLAALSEIKMALPLIEAHCPVSDYHLSLIHTADCALESGHGADANIFLDYLPETVDARIDFPLAYVKAKKDKRALELSSFDDINPHWKRRYQNYADAAFGSAPKTSQIVWDAKSHMMIKDRKQLLGKIKPQSLEGTFLKILMRGPQSKELLCEALWPEYSNTENLDDRFFRLKNRLNQKLTHLISFDGQNYSLATTIVWSKST